MGDVDYIAICSMGGVLAIMIGYGINRLDGTLKEIEEKLPDKVVQIQENINPNELEGKVKNTYLCYEVDSKLLCKPFYQSK